MSDPSQRELIRAALRALGIDRFVLSVHDVSFPSAAGEDVGHGSPYARGGLDFIAFARELGFDGLQLGPQGQTSLGNASPYDGSVFSKSVLSVALAELTRPRFAHVLPPDVLAAAVSRAPHGDTLAHYDHAFATQHAAVATAAAELRARASRGDPEAAALASAVSAFAARTEWLAHDARFEAFATEHGTDAFHRWPERDRAPTPERASEIEQKHAGVVDAYVFGQYVLDAQHRALREHLRELGVLLYGDLQAGISLRDQWSRESMLLGIPRHRMGAPPSRTNPEGQPWGYAVFDPKQWLRRFTGPLPDADLAPLAFTRARVQKLFSELDAIRIDHPHGLVCPWVYDTARGVAQGARLFETPASLEHPALRVLAIARPDQIDESVPLYADDRVRDLTHAQIDEYARIFDLVMECAAAAGRSAREVLCEVLSTCPAPLAAVMKRHGLARFRVTQKASMTQPADGYRSENASRDDWIMIGNHDTEPLQRIVDRWMTDGDGRARAAYLAWRLEPDASRRESFAAAAAADRRKLTLAMFADLFAGPAANVLVFFADLFGEREIYNTPGVIRDDNWRMRVPSAFRDVYAARRARGEALDVAGALALAIRARGEAFVRAHEGLVASLEASAQPIT